MKLFDALVQANLAKSKTEGRKHIQGKGVRLNNFTVIDDNADIFLHGDVWLLVEKNRITAINTKAGTVESKDITLDEYKQMFDVMENK